MDSGFSKLSQIDELDCESIHDSKHRLEAERQRCLPSSDTYNESFEVSDGDLDLENLSSRRERIPPSLRSWNIPILIVWLLLLASASGYLANQAMMIKVSNYDNPTTLPELRIWPLGDSITHGYGSTDKNGYRLPLSKLLAESRTVYDMIGSLKSKGQMEHGRHDGYPGWTISEIANRMGGAIWENPNVVLLHAGTNDLYRHQEAGAEERLMHVVDYVQKRCPDAVVLVSTLLGSWTETLDRRMKAFGPLVREGVEQRRKEGRKVLLVEMPDMHDKNSGLLFDRVHPSDKGYKLMAEVWMKSIREANSLGWIVPPKDVVYQRRHR